MLARLIGPAVRWVLALKTPAACAACSASDRIIAAQAGELSRDRDREKLYLSQIQNLQNKMTALADVRAAVTAARITEDQGPNGPRPRVPRERPLTIPAYAAQLSGGGHVNLARVRDLAVKRQEAVRVGQARPRGEG